MAHLIDKDALVAEIQARIGSVETSQKAGMIKKRDADKKIFLFKSVLSLIDTLEMKEVDLEKSLTGFMGRYAYENGGEYPSAIDIAKHFFELGLETRKKEII